ncbi:hypothetical protein Hbor_39640 (plasmid) [Halogeometricum borinquense DSM 11551]|uniref:Uncharacterized protein n=1 Tax=Halogeometricum borinquense (strain ATCC 700274 / DSM 11551 / JCM 10706 / KCTC 4070 / PR3) TaxID=469382 RepID=E4NW58_HALBP|nr:hypothetical protein Hbor_39640 [Halogeometricum borinquense DSM 11551]
MLVWRAFISNRNDKGVLSAKILQFYFILDRAIVNRIDSSTVETKTKLTDAAATGIAA